MSWALSNEEKKNFLEKNEMNRGNVEIIMKKQRAVERSGFKWLNILFRVSLDGSWLSVLEEQEL